MCPGKNVNDDNNNDNKTNHPNAVNDQVAESSVVFISPGQEEAKSTQIKESLFTEILDKSDGAKAAYSLFAAFSITVIIMDILKCIFDEDERKKLLEMFSGQLCSLPLFFQLYFTLHLIILVLVYPAGRFFKKQPVILIAAGLLTIILIKVQMMYFCLLPLTQNYRPLSMGLSFAIAFESIRLGMKSISFLIECNRLQSHKATLGNFYYHLFSPILVYKADFGRSSGPIRWGKVFYYLAEFVVFVYIFGWWIRSIIVPKLQQLSASYLAKQALTMTYWIDFYFIGTVSTIFFMLFVGYAIIHSFNNLNSELLKFQDRTFYRAWWKSRCVGEWFRKWEFAKHAWIREYIFRPIAEKSMATRAAALALTFTVSGLYHDVVSAMSFGYFFPMFTITMVSTAVLCAVSDSLLIKLPHRTFWTFKVLTQFFGMGLVILYLVAEFQIRTVCPALPEDSFTKDFFTPRIYRCLGY